MPLGHPLCNAALVLVASQLGPPAIVPANVSPTNGNFSVQYVDIRYPGRLAPTLRRVYNSKSSFSGMFGHGWGIAYETSLVVLGDGSVVVHEFGGGADLRFRSVTFASGDVARSIETMALARQELTGIMGADSLLAYRAHLRLDESFRTDEWTALRARRLVPPRELPASTTLYSEDGGYQRLTKSVDGFERTTPFGDRETFDRAGFLIRMQDSNDNWVAVGRDPSERIISVANDLGQAIHFQYNGAGLVSSASRRDGGRAFYTYDSTGNLVRTVDVDGHVYTYAYDGRHNMTRVGYSDGSSMTMTYYPPSAHENIRSVTKSDGSTDTYSFAVDSADSGHISVAVITVDRHRKRSRSVYEFMTRRTDYGHLWTYQETRIVGEDTTHTTYDECCNLPLQVVTLGTTRQRDTSLFEYDGRGHLIRQRTAREVDSLSYNDMSGKLSSESRYVRRDDGEPPRDVSAPVGKGSQPPEASRSRAQPPIVLSYEYDGRGNLVTAYSSAGDSVTLAYDQRGRLNVLRGSTHGLARAGPGAPGPGQDKTVRVTVRYDADNVVHVEGGRNVDIQGALALFGQLLRPAGVDVGL